METRGAAARKPLTRLASAADGHFAHFRGHWAQQRVERGGAVQGRDPGPVTFERTCDHSTPLIVARRSLAQAALSRCGAIISAERPPWMVRAWRSRSSPSAVRDPVLVPPCTLHGSPFIAYAIGFAEAPIPRASFNASTSPGLFGR